MPFLIPWVVKKSCTARQPARGVCSARRHQLLCCPAQPAGNPTHLIQPSDQLVCRFAVTASPNQQGKKRWPTETEPGSLPPHDTSPPLIAFSMAKAANPTHRRQATNDLHAHQHNSSGLVPLTLGDLSRLLIPRRPKPFSIPPRLGREPPFPVFFIAPRPSPPPAGATVVAPIEMEAAAAGLQIVSICLV